MQKHPNRPAPRGMLPPQRPVYIRQSSLTPSVDDPGVVYITEEEKKKSTWRWWFCTWNNPPAESLVRGRLNSLKGVEFWVAAMETAPTTGTRHLHFVVRFTQPRHWGAVQKELHGINMQKCKDINRCIAYVKKDKLDDQIWYMEGCGPQDEGHQQGKRNDLKRFAEVIREVGFTASAQHCPEQMIKYHAGGKAYFNALSDKLERPKPQVQWLYGETGSGKSNWVESECIKRGIPLFICNYNGKWWDGYDPILHKAVLIDDARQDTWSFTYMLKLLDTYKVQVETKGGWANLIPEYMFVTTPLHPVLEYGGGRTDADYAQLSRRITRCKWFKGQVVNQSEGGQHYAQYCLVSPKQVPPENFQPEMVRTYCGPKRAREVPDFDELMENQTIELDGDVVRVSQVFDDRSNPMYEKHASAKQRSPEYSCSKSFNIPKKRLVMERTIDDYENEVQEKLKEATDSVSQRSLDTEEEFSLGDSAASASTDTSFKSMVALAKKNDARYGTVPLVRSRSVAPPPIWGRLVGLDQAVVLSQTDPGEVGSFDYDSPEDE